MWSGIVFESELVFVVVVVGFRGLEEVVVELADALVEAVCFASA